MHRKIKELSEVTINRIAAGEVVERPASVVKELIENSIDAGSTNIDITINSGGRNLIIISDNGAGMSKEDLELAVQRHTTSKLNEEDLFDINFFGFRGEALASIGSVSKLTIASKIEGEDAWQINVSGGVKSGLIPTSLAKGTKIEVRDLFYVAPARLKFLKSEKQETANIKEIVEKIALANPKIAFSLTSDGKNLLDLPVMYHDLLNSRIKQIMGKDFIENSIEIDLEYNETKIYGFVSLPTKSRTSTSYQYLFVNKRPVKDKLLQTSLKIAYQNFLENNRYPEAVLFLEVPKYEVDVNVHPAKLEVRFKDANFVRQFIVTSIKDALETHGNKVSTSIAVETINQFIPSNTAIIEERPTHRYQSSISYSSQSKNKISYPTMQREIFKPIDLEPIAKAIYVEEHIETKTIEDKLPLGVAKCQINKTYIISMTEDALIITDQHAAHERIVYEKLKEMIESSSIKTQRLLIPEIVELDEDKIEILLSHVHELSKFGLVFNKITSKSIMITEVPALLGDFNISSLVKDIVDDYHEYGANINARDLETHIISTFACHHSIRSGREMNYHEMNALLREMEQTKHSAQCNHGRPTYIELKLQDLEKLFSR